MNSRFSKFRRSGGDSGHRPHGGLRCAVPARLSQQRLLSGGTDLPAGVFWRRSGNTSRDSFPCWSWFFFGRACRFLSARLWTCRTLGGPGRGCDCGFRALHAQRAITSFSTFHLVAVFCVLAALVSAAVSSFPMLSFLKALSLLLLFLYASTGARLALAGREEKFFPRLLVAGGNCGLCLCRCLPGLAAFPSMATRILWAPLWGWLPCLCCFGGC